MQGDTEFEHDPKIFSDYEDTREKLDKGLVTGEGVRFESKEREFDQWFTNTKPWYE